MELLPIKKTLEENQEFLAQPDCRDNIYMSVDFYERKGFNPPWIGYFAQVDGKLVGGVGFKGKPQAGKVEIGYGTFPPYQQQGFGTEMCRRLVVLALETDPAIRVMARTLPENYGSAAILKKNNFELLGTVYDEEDGDVWEWEFKGQLPAKETGNI